MMRICWWCVDIVSRMLDPDEQDAVRGDFAESGETSGQALRGLLGLVLRRQTVLWRNWRPWLALVGAVAPFGILLSLASRRMADSTAVTSWLYLNNWDWTYVRNTGFRLDFARDVAFVLFGFLLLSCWSWTSGFVLGYLSRRAIWINGALFCLVLVTVELGGMPRFLGRSLLLSRDRTGVHDAVFAVAFYRDVFPLILSTVLVLLPSLWGMRQGLRLAALPLPLRTMLWASLALAVTTLAMQNSVWWQVRTWNNQPPPPPPAHLPFLAPLAVIGPLGYILATTTGRRWSARYRASRPSRQ